MQEAGFDTALDPGGNNYQRIIADRTPDLVILDLHLPFASGKEILAGLRKHPETSNISTLVVTADLYLARDIRAANEHVIMKPVSPLRLMELTRTILQGKENEHS